MPEPTPEPKAVEVNLPVTLEPREGDLDLHPDLCRQLSLFRMLRDPRRMPKFEQFPGAVRVRRYRADETVWQQGDVGTTALYILTAEDLRLVTQSHAEVLRYWFAPDAPEQRTLVATVHLAVAPQIPARAKPTGLWERLFGRAPAAPPDSAPPSIPFDGPADIDYKTLEARMYPGEVFGEAGCLEGLPRSATVVVRRGWYLLEIERNIFAELYRDAGYQAYWDDLYKRRGLGLHMRKFSVFRELSDEEFTGLLRDGLADLDSRKAAGERLLDLVTFKHGEVICEEHDTPDSMYVIRSGLVQVVKNVSPLLGPGDLVSPPALTEALSRGAHPLHEKARPRLAAAAGEPAVLAALNDLIRDAAFGAAPDYAGLSHPTANLATEAKGRTRQPRRFNRLLLEALFPQALRPWGEATPVVLAYRGRGETIGEMGVVLGRPRNATCIAYSHRDGKMTQVSLLRINARSLEPLLRPGSPFLESLSREAARRDQESRKILAGGEVAEGRAASHSRRFDELNLIQGQKLLLIDLERCTRCDECVRACVATHGDGHTRLHLDGPRFDRPSDADSRQLLVPTTCRSCRNPECMMNCPVASIHRGGRGQIVIEPWCIGCGRCAQYCPYGAIHMHGIGVVPEGSGGWQYRPAAAVPGGAWRQPGFAARDWHMGAAPFRYDFDFRAGLGPTPEPGGAILFRRAFGPVPGHDQPRRHFHLRLTTSDQHAAAWVNGQEVPAERRRDPKTGAWEIEADIPRTLVVADRNLVAAQVTPAPGPGVLFDLGLYHVDAPEVPAAQGLTLTPKVVRKQAVVCDLCSSLPGGPACVKACPHEAAFRLDAAYGVARW